MGLFDKLLKKKEEPAPAEETKPAEAIWVCLMTSASYQHYIHYLRPVLPVLRNTRRTGYHWQFPYHILDISLLLLFIDSFYKNSKIHYKRKEKMFQLHL